MFDETVTETLKEMIKFLNSDIRTVTDLNLSEINNLVKLRLFFKMIGSDTFDMMVDDYLHFLISKNRYGRKEILELVNALIKIQKSEEEEKKKENSKKLSDLFFAKIR